MRRRSALLACALACARTSAPPPPPAPAAVDPPGSYFGQPTLVRLRGAGFTLGAVQQLGGGGHIALQEDFRAFLGTAPLQDVRWVDSSTLLATVPASVPPGTYALSVQGPYGNGTVDGVFRVVDALPASLGASATAPAEANVGPEFTVSQTISNSGGMTALQVAAGTPFVLGPAATVQAPAGMTDIPAGGNQVFSWRIVASAAGSLQLTLPVTGVDEVDHRALTAQSTVTVTIADAALLAQDRFADGTTAFSYVFAYAGRVYLGPSRDGTRAVRMQPDGTGVETVQLAFQPDPGKNQNLATPPAAGFPSLGYIGCAADTLQCGPDNEDGRGLFIAFSSSGTERLFAVGGRQASIIKHGYVTSDTNAVPSFSPIAVNVGGGVRGASSAVAIGATLYVGTVDGSGSGQPAILPIAQPFDTSHVGTAVFPNDLNNGGSGTGLVDAMLGLNGVLYAANDGGCVRYDGVAWTACTPSASQWGLPPVTTSKVTDFVPADKAVPQMAAFGGNLYMARNTTSGPQLWICSTLPTPCGPADWALAAANGTGNANLSQFDDPTLNTVSLLVATSQHLYVGYDAPSGLVLYRSTNASPSLSSHFARWAPAGLGAGMTQIVDGQALTFAGNDYLYVAANAPSGAVQIFRLVP